MIVINVMRDREGEREINNFSSAIEKQFNNFKTLANSQPCTNVIYRPMQTCVRLMEGNSEGNDEISSARETVILYAEQQKLASDS